VKQAVKIKNYKKKPDIQGLFKYSKIFKETSLLTIMIRITNAKSGFTQYPYNLVLINLQRPLKELD